MRLYTVPTERSLAVAAPSSGVVVRWLNAAAIFAEWLLGLRLFSVPASSCEHLVAHSSPAVTRLFGPQNHVRYMFGAFLGAANSAPYSPYGRWRLGTDLRGALLRSLLRVSVARSPLSELPRVRPSAPPTHGPLTAARRKHVLDRVVRRPAAAAVRIKQPLVVTGLPRTGSTLLHSLLVCDPNAFFLKGDDDSALLAHQLYPTTTLFPALPHAPLDEKRVASDYLLEVYVYLKRYIQLFFLDHLEAVPKAHVLLASPYHSKNLQALLSVFPDARIITTHRSPFKVLPAYAQHYATIQAPLLAPNSVDAHDFGARVLRDAHEMAAGLTETRRSLRREQSGFVLLPHTDANADAEVTSVSEEQFLDIHYAGLEGNPVETVQEIYTYFGLDYTEAFERAMREYLKNHPHRDHESGNLATLQKKFGYSKEAIDKEFADYIAEFDIQVEYD
ncbi:P-loop containing nucleoside triphosphate hydrolase protein [Chytriomyces sp. MP71]|nr:P-loop containing nucleoside triphosphate hydrolase protein [Chytriomyces sp. MP71]